MFFCCIQDVDARHNPDLIAGPYVMTARLCVSLAGTRSSQQE